nr:hypothetical protein [Tanacetum cinerariifolium]
MLTVYQPPLTGGPVVVNGGPAAVNGGDGWTNWKMTRHHGTVAAVEGSVRGSEIQYKVQGSEIQYKVQKKEYSRS